MRLAVVPLLLVACSSEPDPYAGSSCRPLPGPITCGPCGPGETTGRACYGSTERPCACPVDAGAVDAGAPTDALDVSTTPGPDASPSADADAALDAPRDTAPELGADAARDAGADVLDAGDAPGDAPDPLETRSSVLRILRISMSETLDMPIALSCRATAAELSFVAEYDRGGGARSTISGEFTPTQTTFTAGPIDISPTLSRTPPYEVMGARRVNARVVGIFAGMRIEALVLGCPYT